MKSMKLILESWRKVQEQEEQQKFSGYHFPCVLECEAPNARTGYLVDTDWMSIFVLLLLPFLQWKV